MHEYVVDTADKISFTWLFIAFLRNFRSQLLEEGDLPNHTGRLRSKHDFADPPEHLTRVEKARRACRDDFTKLVRLSLTTALILPN